MHSMIDQLDAIMPTGLTGRLVGTEGATALAAGFPAPLGAIVEIDRQAGRPAQGEVVGFRGEQTIIYPYGDLAGARRGNQVRLARTSRYVKVGEQLLGRVVDARLQAIDGRSQPILPAQVPLDAAPPPPAQRPRISEPLATGIRAIDSMLTCGKGQRMGIFAGSGVGKSVLMGMMSRYTSADVNVIALIGERGREVNDFLQRDLGPEGLQRSVVVVATSDQPALLRVRAAMAATAVAEYFRDQGRDVMLMMDSITRFAMSQREIGLAAGEPPTTRGYPPSVFALLPKLVERAGRSEAGSITAFYTVLVEGDDTNEPVSDAVRGLLDGHTILSRKLASQGHYPAIDVLASLSRLMPDIAPAEQLQAATDVRRMLAAYQENEDLISIGAYRQGGNRWVDAALALREPSEAFLRQAVEQRSEWQQTQAELIQLARQIPPGGGQA